MAVPLNHPLAKKDKIDLSELSNEKIMAITGGDSKQNKDILNRLITECENIEIKDAPFFYNIDVFNTCEENGYLSFILYHKSKSGLQGHIKEVPIVIV